MARLNTGAQQVAALAKAVGVAFAKARLPAEALTQPAIKHTTMPWQLPPLKTDIIWQGMSLQDLLTVTLNVDEHSLWSFWTLTLDALAKSPTATMRKGLYVGLRNAAPGERSGSKRYVFSTPYGFPGLLDEAAGLTFSLEAAKLAQDTLALSDFVDQRDNYYAVTPKGLHIGVREGRPIAKAWQMDGRGMIRDLLEMPRGAVTDFCAYDTIALARSLLVEYKAKFGADYQAVEYALQALRVLTIDRHCPELVRVIADLPEVNAERQEHIKELEYCRGVMATSMPDRNKLAAIRASLVGKVITATTFKREIFYSDDYPAVLSLDRYQQINSWLENRLTELSYAE